MSISVNGQSQVPPGFRFHPTEEELLQYYLRKKVSYEKIDLDVIRDVDLNKLEPWDIQESCKIGTTPQNDWLDDNIVEITVSNAMGEGTQEEGWVVCRIFKKKNHHKTLDNPASSSLSSETRNHMFGSCNEGDLEQILEHMRRNCNEDGPANHSSRFIRPIETAISNGYHPDSFIKLPSLDSPNSTSSQNCYQPMVMDNEGSIRNQVSGDPNSVYRNESRLTNWAALDRLVASQLNGQTETSRQLACFNDTSVAYCSNPSTDHQQQHDVQVPGVRYNSEIDLWGFTRSSSSSSDPLCHVVNASV
ncbi:hypothetical protein GQ457_04G030270 [Hibiscus cannabinus]